MNYNKNQPDATKKPIFSVIQKCPFVMRLLKYGIASDDFNEYLQMRETTSNEILDDFCKCVFDLYSNIYFRNPT